jgi:hypothetical protein
MCLRSLAMYRRALLPVAFMMMATPTLAQEAELCPLTDAGGNCVRILACLGDQGRWFHGRAYGRGEGVLFGMVNDGVTCSGTWLTQNARGQGQANVTCSDGMQVTVLYDHQDVHTGTAIGQGIANTKDLVKAWSGNHVLAFFQDGSVKATITLPCGS